MKALNTAFDPLSSTGGKSTDVGSDLITEAGANLSLAESLSQRLLGAYTQVREETIAEQVQPEKLTPAQAAAKQVSVIDGKYKIRSERNMHFFHFQMLTKRPADACLMSELASEVTAHQVSSLARRSMNKSQFSCCPHCTGQVKII